MTTADERPWWELTDEHRKWCEERIGKRIRPWQAAQRGTIVDYKPDITGLGVFFIVVMRNGDEHETYRYFPEHQFNQTHRHETASRGPRKVRGDYR